MSPPVVDFHIHWSPRGLVARAVGALPTGDAKLTRYVDGIPTYTFHPQLYDLDGHLAMMDFAGVDMAVISSAEGMTGDLERCRVVNDELAREVGRFDGRIVGMGHTGPLDWPAGRDELERAWDMGLKGVAIASTLSGKGLDDEALFPFYERVQERGSFVFVHPTLACGTLGSTGFGAYDLFRTVGREFELIAAILRLVCGGVLDRFPGLNVVMSHLGGGITSMVGRIRDYQDKAFWGLLDDPVHGKRPAREIDHYLRERLFFDTGGHFGDMTAVQAALLNVPPSRILFGTDYPQEIRDERHVKRFVESLRSMRLDEQEIEGILGGTARELLGAKD